MAKNATLYWSLTQVFAWALTRDREFVEQIPDLRNYDIQSAIRQSALRDKGRNITAELWKVSGWTVPSGDTIATFDVKRVGEQTFVPSNFADIADDRLPRFPIERYLLERLLRRGKLASRLKRPGEPRYWKASPGDWNDLELFYRDDVLVAASRGGERTEYFLVQGSEADALCEFPAEPLGDVAAALDVEAADPTRNPSAAEWEMLFRELEVKIGRPPPQRKFAETARKSFPQANRDLAREAHKALVGEEKLGRPRAGKN
jgi:hypothetical protein